MKQLYEKQKKYSKTDKGKLARRRAKGNYALKVKAEVFGHYSPHVNCVRCRFSDIRALSIDHINGGGTSQRDGNRLVGYRMYMWLKNNGYPEGFQVLCMNCQFIKRVENKEYGAYKLTRNQLPHSITN